MKRDTPIVGFLIGLFLPVLGIYIMYLLWGQGSGFGNFLHSLIRLKQLATKVLTLGLLPSLAPFIYCIYKHYDYALRGIFTATMLYAVFIILVMFVW